MINIRYLLRLGYLCVITNAGLCSELNPSERCHSSLSRILSGEEIGEEHSLEVARQRIMGSPTTFSGQKVVALVLADALSLLPPPLVELSSTHTTAARRGELIADLTPLSRPEPLKVLLRKLKIDLDQAPDLTCADLHRISEGHSIVKSQYCIDYVTCLVQDCNACGGSPRGGILSTDQRKMLSLHPVPDPDNPGHYLRFSDALLAVQQPLNASHLISVPAPSNAHPFGTRTLHLCEALKVPDLFAPTLVLKSIASCLMKEADGRAVVLEDRHLQRLAGLLLLSVPKIREQLTHYLGILQQRGARAAATVQDGMSATQVGKITMKRLKEYAAMHGLPIPSGLKKPELVNLVIANLQGRDVLGSEP